MEKVSIDLFGLTLMEPSTYISDILLTAFSVSLFLSLKKAFPSSKHNFYYSRFFLFMGGSTLVGGHAHLLAHYIDHNFFHVLSWAFSALGLYFMQMGSVYDYSQKVKRILQPVFLAQVVISIAIFFGYQIFGDVTVDHNQVGTPGFAAVKVSQSIGYLAFILPLQINKFIKEKDNGASIILMGMVVSVGALLVQSKQWGFAPNFNHNDIAHLILAFVYYLFYLGIRIKVSQNNEELS